MCSRCPARPPSSWQVNGNPSGGWRQPPASGCSSAWSESSPWKRVVASSNLATQTKHCGYSSIGRAAGFQPADIGSIPIIRSTFPRRLARLACLSGLNPVMSFGAWEFDPLSLRQIDGELSLTGKALDCDPRRSRFEPGRSPQKLPVAKLDEGTWARTRRRGGSSPSGQASSVLGLVVEQQAFNLSTGVRFSQDGPVRGRRSQAGLITPFSRVRIPPSRPIDIAAVAQLDSERDFAGVEVRGSSPLSRAN